MADSAYCEPPAEILATVRARGFSLKERQLADWHRNGLLPQPKKVGLGRGRGTVTCYPRGATRQAYDLLRLRKEYGRRNFGMIGWMLSMRGYDVDPRYWKDPVTDAVNDWDKIAQFTETDDDGTTQLSDRFFNSLTGIPRTTLNRTALGVFLKRLRPDHRETFLVTLMRVRFGNPAIADSWDNQAKQANMDISGWPLDFSNQRKHDEIFLISR
jgi:hypothetical protein